VLVRRKGGEVESSGPTTWDYMDVSRANGSVATAMIPFLEHDRRQKRHDGLEHAAAVGAADAHAEEPLVGTGMEYRAATGEAGDVIPSRRRRAWRGV